MAFSDFSDQGQSVQLLQRSLQRGRLAHGYLFTGQQLDDLESIARTLAKTLNCLRPITADGARVDCCDECLNCRKIENGNHADVHWVRPESRSRVVRIEQMRDLMQEINLRPTEAEFKVAVVVGADRLNVQAANAFLKTLEEPPAKSVLILLSTEPQRLLETILSRCLRLNFGGEGARRFGEAQVAWLTRFSELAAAEQRSLLGRYRLMDVLSSQLNEMKTRVEEAVSARSPLEKYDEVDKDLREKWEEELKAAIESEYRRQRADVLLALEYWLRDVWLCTLACGRELLNFPSVTGAEQVAKRINPRLATENLSTIEGMQRLLHTNVQEALALEVGLLKLNL